MGKIKLVNSTNGYFIMSGKSYLKGQYVIEYTDSDTQNNGDIINPENIQVFLRTISNNNKLFPLKTSRLWTDFIDENDNPYPDFETFSEALATIATASVSAGGATNLGYTPSPTNGTVTNDNGTSSILPLADGTNAGLLKPAKYTVLENTSGTNTGDNSANTNSNAYADAKVTDAIVDGVTAIAPSQNAVFDALALKAPLASPAFTGTPTAPTQSANDNSTKIATTAYVDSINSKKVKFSGTTPTSPLTGTTTETQMLKLTIPIGTFSLTDFIDIEHLRLVKTTATSTVTWRIKISTSSTMPSGNTDRVAVFTDATGARTQELLRTFWQNGGNLTGVDFATSLNSDIAIVSTTLSTQAFNNTTTQYYLYVSAQLTNSADSVYIANYEITN